MFFKLLKNPTILLSLGGVFLILIIIIQYQMISYQNGKIDQYKNSLEISQKNVENLQTDIKKIRSSLEKIQNINAEANTAFSNLSDTLSKLESATIGKPSLVEKYVNRAQKERNECFAIATGKASENMENRLCPQLLK